VTASPAVAESQARALAARFPGWSITVRPHWGGTAFHAIRLIPAEAGLYAVITRSEDEMRAALGESSRSGQ